MRVRLLEPQIFLLKARDHYGLSTYSIFYLKDSIVDLIDGKIHLGELRLTPTCPTKKAKGDVTKPMDSRDTDRAVLGDRVRVGRKKSHKCSSPWHTSVSKYEDKLRSRGRSSVSISVEVD